MRFRSKWKEVLETLRHWYVSWIYWTRQEDDVIWETVWGAETPCELSNHSILSGFNFYASSCLISDSWDDVLGEMCEKQNNNMNETIICSFSIHTFWCAGSQGTERHGVWLTIILVAGQGKTLLQFYPYNWTSQPDNLYVFTSNSSWRRSVIVWCQRRFETFCVQPFISAHLKTGCEDIRG